AKLTGVPTSENEGALFKQDMAKIGVKVNLVNTPSDSFIQTLSSHSSTSSPSPGAPRIRWLTSASSMALLRRGPSSRRSPTSLSSSIQK
ncbi:hypothetical protein P5837_30520, partial [Bacillus cereus]|nr:hypothetical protein [Bacillus cereus]